MTQARVQWLGAALLLLSACGWWLARPMFFAAWLAAWWFCLSLMLGASINGCIHTLTAGRWGDVLAPAHRALQRPMPWLLLLFLPLLAGLHFLYPWAAGSPQWTARMAQPAFQRAWFAPAFVAARLVAYAFAWWRLARHGELHAPGRAAVALIICMGITSLACVDLLMSLTPGWTSSVFGWLVLSGQMTAGAAAATAMAAARGTRDITDREPVWRDLGNFLLMCVMLQAYLQFMQFLIIWAENLPREISWYLPRLQTGWWMVGAALVLLQFAAPVFALLWRRIKDEPRRLMWVALGIVAMQAVDCAWLVVPSVQPHGWAAWWLLPLVLGGMTLLLFGRAWPVGKACDASEESGDARR